MHYPMFSPKSTAPGNILVYSWEEIWKGKNGIRNAACGAQAEFLRNGARANDPNQYGLKLYERKWDAICAYERQKLAAVYMVAPPVGQLIQVRDKTNKIRYWGYQTCVAIQVEPDMRCWHELFPTEHSKWNGPTRLRRLLRGISLRGLPNNDLTTRGLRSETPIRGRAKYCLGGDLHTHNVMLWSDEHGERPVCIDFGYHCVLSSNRGPICQVYDRA